MDGPPGGLVRFYTDTGGKILRLPASENKILIGDDISKRDLRLGRVEMSSQFCFLRQAIFIRIFANSVCCKKNKHLPGVQLWKNILNRKERSFWDNNILPLIKTSCGQLGTRKAASWRNGFTPGTALILIALYCDIHFAVRQMLAG